MSLTCGQLLRWRFAVGAMSCHLLLQLLLLLLMLLLQLLLLLLMLLLQLLLLLLLLLLQLLLLLLQLLLLLLLCCGCKGALLLQGKGLKDQLGRLVAV